MNLQDPQNGATNVFTLLKTRFYRVKELFEYYEGMGDILFVAIVGFGILMALVFLACRIESWAEDAYPPTTPLIETSMRDSALHPGTGVLVSKNISGRQLTNVVVSVRNLDSGQSAKHKIESIRPGETIELGVLEMGWTFIPNEEIQILYEDQPFNAKRGAKSVIDNYRHDVYLTYKADTGVIGISFKASKPVNGIDALVELAK